MRLQNCQMSKLEVWKKILPLGLISTTQMWPGFKSWISFQQKQTISQQWNKRHKGFTWIFDNSRVCTQLWELKSFEGWQQRMYVKACRCTHLFWNKVKQLFVTQPREIAALWLFTFCLYLWLLVWRLLWLFLWKKFGQFTFFFLFLCGLHKLSFQNYTIKRLALFIWTNRTL